MATQHAVDEAGIRQHIDTLVQAIRVMDLEGVKPTYAPDMVSFDVGAPLQHVGAGAKWRNWADAFAPFQRPLGVLVRQFIDEAWNARRAAATPTPRAAAGPRRSR